MNKRIPILLRDTSCTTSGTLAEEKTAKRIAAKLQPSSGSLDGAKGDMVLGDTLIENKATRSRTMRLELHWLRKISHEATSLGKTPALAIQFVDAEGNPVPNGKWVMVQEATFQKLLEE